MSTDWEILERYKPVLVFDSRERCYPIVHARLVVEGVDTWAQYWMLYERDYSPLPWRRGHRNDVEMVQYLVRDEVGVLAAYTQHDLGECRELAGHVPHVYVALGKHACYFTRGYHARGGFDLDRANGKGRRLFAPLEPITQRPAGHHPQWEKPTTWAWSLRGAKGMP